MAMSSRPRASAALARSSWAGVSHGLRARICSPYSRTFTHSSARRGEGAVLRVPGLGVGFGGPAVVTDESPERCDFLAAADHEGCALVQALGFPLHDSVSTVRGCTLGLLGEEGDGIGLVHEAQLALG